MPVSITATSTPAPVAPDCAAPMASRTSSSDVPGVAAACALEPLSAQPLMRPSPTTATTPALAPRARSESAGTCATKPLTTGSDCPTVPPLRSTARCAAASLSGSARTITACMATGAGPREINSSATAASTATKAAAISRR